MTTKKPAKVPTVADMDYTQMAAAISEAQRGDKAALALARQIIKERPEIKDALGQVARDVRRRLVLHAYGKDNQFMADVFEDKAQAMEKELMGSHPSPLERILCERIATAYLDVEMAETLATQGVTLTLAAYYDKRLTLANKRYVQAVEALAKVRRLQLPVQQFNIAQPGAQQLNLAVTAEPSPAVKAIAGATE